MNEYNFNCHYKIAFNTSVAIDPILRTINIDLIQQPNGEYEPASLANWMKNLIDVNAI